LSFGGLQEKKSNIRGFAKGEGGNVQRAVGYYERKKSMKRRNVKKTKKKKKGKGPLGPIVKRGVEKKT